MSTLIQPPHSVSSLIPGRSPELLLLRFLTIGWSMEHNLFLNLQETSHLDISDCSSFTGPAAVLASQVAFSWCRRRGVKMQGGKGNGSQGWKQ